MNTVQRIVKNTASLSIAQIAGKGLSFVAVVYLARILDPGSFGKINFAYAIVSYFTLFTSFGLDILGAREIARSKDEIGNYVGNIITLRLILATLAFCFLLLFVLFLNKPIEMKYLIIFYGLILFPYVLALDWVFQGIERMGYIGISGILNLLFYVGLVLLLVKSSGQLLLVPCIQVLASLLSSGLLIFIFIKQFGKVKLRVNLPLWKALIQQALPIGISSIVILILYNMDTVMLGFMRSNEEVGYYNAAYKIILFFVGLIGAYASAIFPICSYYYKTSLDLLRRLQFHSAKLMVTIALPLAVGGTMLAKPLMNLIYGTKYDNGIIAFQILIWAMFIISVNCIYSRGLWACDKQNKYLIIVIIQAITNLIFNFLLIPRLGINGAAIATVLAEIIGFPLYYSVFNKIVPAHIHKHVLKPLLASIAMGFLLQLGLKRFNLNLFSLILSGVFIYSILIYLVKGVTKQEIGLIQRAIFSKGQKISS